MTKSIRKTVPKLFITFLSLALALLLGLWAISGLSTRFGMNARLKLLAINPIPVIETYGAMCYDVAAPTSIPRDCDKCDAGVEVADWEVWSTDRIRALVSEMEDEGHDVILDIVVFCEECSEQGSAKHHVSFGIKFTGDEQYYMSESSIVNDYVILLAFLRGERSYTTSNDATVSLRRELAVIEKMTGLGHGR